MKWTRLSAVKRITAGVILLLLFFIQPHVSAQRAIATFDIKYINELISTSSGTLSLPSDVAVDENYIYVVDGGNHRIAVFDHVGAFQFIFGGEGNEQGQLEGPIGIDASTNGHVYVADSGNKRVQIFDSRGNFISGFEVLSGKNQIRPTDVLVDEQRQEIYVTGNNNHMVMVFATDGKLKRQWGGNGLNPGEFRYPATLAFLQDMRIAVVDILNTRIQVFNRDGSFSIEVGEWGVLAGQLFRPKGVAVDREGRIYVSDSYTNVIQVFSDTGRFLYKLNTMDMPGHLDTPAGITIYDNRLYVAEMLANRVSIFDLKP